jgi:Tfp pilus assembly protein PilF
MKAVALLSLAMLGACATPPEPSAVEASKPVALAAAPRQEASPPPQQPAPAKLASAGEPALAEGIKAYQAGQYKQAEAQLKQAVQAGLAAPANQANAHKHLAFIYCMSKRDKLCGAAFKSAKAVDPSFALSKAEAGHPMWAGTYKKALGLK